MDAEDVTIIGAGPAGIAAAIQLKRYGITPVVLERDSIGGLLRNANLVENYPGFPEGIPGLELVDLFEEQVKRASLDIRREEVVSVGFEGGVFLVETTGARFQTHILVAASGTKPRRFDDLEIHPELEDKVFYEVYPLLGERGKEVAIVGAGDAAFDYALNLSRKNRVTILNRTNELKCLPLLWERALENSNIKYLENTEIKKLRTKSGKAMTLECTGPNGLFELEVDYLIGAIGREPNLDFLSSAVAGQIEGLRSQGILFLIGDVKNEIFRQTSIAVGDGVMAAMQIANNLRENGT